MIISRTPFRISFFGGGTDFPEWFEGNNGAVVSTTFNKYGYIFCQPTSDYLDYRYRIAYRLTEIVSDIDSIQHPAVKAALRYLKIQFGVELDYHGDLMARSGIGSSSAFCVGLLDTLYQLTGRKQSRARLAQEAVYLERDVLGEVVGFQDQYICALGGLNLLHFSAGSTVSITPISIPSERVDEIDRRLVLVYSGVQRDSSEVSKPLLSNMAKNEKLFCSNYEMALRAGEILRSNSDLDEFGEMFRQAWSLKAQMNDKAVTDELNEIYELGIEKGALGGKVLGAGGGGFMMFWIKSDDRERFVSEMKGVTVIPIRIESSGTTTVFSDVDNSVGG